MNVRLTELWEMPEDQMIEFMRSNNLPDLIELLIDAPEKPTTPTKETI
jgi:hypothetical protein